MRKYFFMHGILDALGTGRLFASVTSTVIYFFTVIYVLGFIVSWLSLWDNVFDLTFVAILGGVLFQVCHLGIGIVVFQILWIRAGQMSASPADEFAVVPIIGFIIRLVGEVLAAITLLWGVGAGLLLLFAGPESRVILDETLDIPFPLSGHIAPAASALALGMVGSFLILLLHYLLSELIVAIVSIAKDAAAIRRRLSTGQEIKSES